MSYAPVKTLSRVRVSVGYRFLAAFAWVCFNFCDLHHTPLFIDLRRKYNDL